MFHCEIIFFTKFFQSPFTEILYFISFIMNTILLNEIV